MIRRIHASILLYSCSNVTATPVSNCSSGVNGSRIRCTQSRKQVSIRGSISGRRVPSDPEFGSPWLCGCPRWRLFAWRSARRQRGWRHNVRPMVRWQGIIRAKGRLAWWDAWNCANFGDGTINYTCDGNPWMKHYWPKTYANPGENRVFLFCLVSCLEILLAAGSQRVTKSMFRIASCRQAAEVPGKW